LYSTNRTNKSISTTIGELPIKAYGWSFGDASIIIMPASIPSVQHTYKEKGIYNVALMVADTQDRNGRLYKTIEVK
jgi:PKD repeat protein